MISEDIQLMIDKICRSCMCQRAEMYNVFEKSAGSSDEPMLLSDMLTACTSLEVNNYNYNNKIKRTICIDKLLLNNQKYLRTFFIFGYYDIVFNNIR